MLIAWTTVETQEDAEALARLAVERHLAVCVQVDGPITSFYHWESAVTRSSEYRLCFKFLEAHSAALENLVLSHHRYSTPEWVVIRSEHIAEKYLSWAVGVSTSSTL